MEKFYPLTPSMSQKLRKSKLTKHEMALWLYLIEKDPFGDRYWQLPSTLEITTELEMSKASYFRARAKLQELELFDFQEQRVDCRNLTGVSKMRLESQKCDSKSQKRDSKSQKCDSKSQKRESQRPKPSPGKDYSSLQTYSDFIQTLSEEERANFLNFCEEKTKNLSQPVNDIEAWLAHTNKAGKNRWEVYYEKYLTTKQVGTKKTETKSALLQFRQELEEQQRQAQKAWEQSQNQKELENTGGVR
ncbi:MAG: hypothetical protein ACYTXE_36485 [Nostoc sp.]